MILKWQLFHCDITLHELHSSQYYIDYVIHIAHLYSNQIHNSSCIATLTKLHLWLHAVLLPLLFLLENDQHVACYLGLMKQPNFLLIQLPIFTAFEYDSNDNAK